MATKRSSQKIDIGASLRRFGEQFQGLNPNDPSVWRRVTGWERKGLGVSRRGGSDIVLRELRDEYACPVCVARLRAGLDARQESLL